MKPWLRLYLSSIVHRPSSIVPPATRIQVCLLGWYGSDNTGDEAVLEAIVGALHKRGITQLHAFSTNPAKTSARFGISSSTRSLFSLATIQAFRRSRALILGGGGLIQDRTSVYNLPIYALFVLAARLFGLKVVGWGLGVEPVDTRLGKLLARFICNSSAYVSVRDAGAKHLLVRAGIPPERVTVSADPAFLIGRNAAARKEKGEKPTVVFCLRDLPDNRPGLNLHYLLPISVRRKLGIGKIENDERTTEFVEAMARSVRLCVQEFHAQVEFLPLWPGRDDPIIRRVMSAAQRLGVPSEAMRFVEVEPVASKVAEVVSDADLLVSMRLHALIFGASAGVPSLALAYARKMRGLMRSLRAERWVVEVETRNPTPEEIEEKLRLLWETRQAQGVITRAAADTARAVAERDSDAVARLLGLV